MFNFCGWLGSNELVPASYVPAREGLARFLSQLRESGKSDLLSLVAIVGVILTESVAEEIPWLMKTADPLVLVVKCGCLFVLVFCPRFMPLFPCRRPVWPAFWIWGKLNVFPIDKVSQWERRCEGK